MARSPDRHRGTSRLANLALPRLRAADLQAGVEVPLLRHLARMGRPLVGLGAMAPSSLPTVDLMHPTQIAKLFHRAGRIYEEKVDGWRMVAIKSEHGGRLVSRNGRDHTRRFPELVKALSGLSGFEGIVAKNPAMKGDQRSRLIRALRWQASDSAL